MRKRIERQIEQRTMMLSGVSHDLRTILTRFKLQLALAKGSFDTTPLEQDVADMQNMLEGYLAFARGEGTENVGELDLSELMKTLQKDAALRERGFVYHIEGSPLVQLKPKAFSRLVSNLVSNSFRYAKNVDVAIVHDDNDLVIIIDDDGPGIPANMREEVFKPFFRLDEARNQDASGTGLGLSIAQDIARSHGGNIVLDDSPTGGLRVIVEIPL